MNNDLQENEAETSDLEVVEDAEVFLPDVRKKLAGLRERLASCEKERKDYLDGWQRARADFINYKNDEAKRLEDIARFVTQSMLEDLLPLLDSFDLALQNMDKDRDQGVFLIRAQLLDLLKKRGVEPINAKKGDPFDPEKHESVGETESDAPAGTIADVVQKGYMLRERVVRPVRIRLAKNR